MPTSLFVVVLVLVLLLLTRLVLVIWVLFMFVDIVVCGYVYTCTSVFHNMFHFIRVSFFLFSYMQLLFGHAYVCICIEDAMRHVIAAPPKASPQLPQS